MVVTRFAPSPTGYLHIGGLRTALFCYLWARKNKGKFLLRIEDTDLARNSREALEAIIQAFKWVGMDYDDEVVYQSRRFEMYRGYINQLIDAGKAYYCYMSKEELDTLREEQQKRGEKPMYDRRYRDFDGTPPEGIDPVVRIKAPLEGSIDFHDGVKGDISVDCKELDDFIIARSDGTPTYNFVVAIDDALMGVTEVIRGDDHLSNTPKQIIVYNALGFSLPTFYHVPMILSPEGKKLSKRDGAMDVMEYEKMGYLPEALLNFLVRLGWSHGDQEIFTPGEMLSLFDPKDINTSASAYNQEKLLWLNSHYIKNMPNDSLARLLEKQNLFLTSHDKREILLDAAKDRARTLLEVAEIVNEVIQTPSEYEQKPLKKAIKADTPEILEAFITELSDKDPHLPIDYESLANAFMESRELGMGKFGQPIRLSLLGKGGGPAIFDIMSVIGKEETIKRIQNAITYFKTYLEEKNHASPNQ